MGITQGQMDMFFPCLILDLPATSKLISAIALPPWDWPSNVHRIRSSRTRSMLDGDMEQAHAVNGVKHGKYVSRTFHVQFQPVMVLEY
jgi:hypothetical protein